MATINAKGKQLVKEFNILTPSERSRVGNLSGGNKRKVILAREMSFDPKVVVYNKPTYGLDIRTTLTVRRRIASHAASGVGSLLISTDLDELISICHRIAVLYRGQVTGVVENTRSPEMRQVVGRLMLGGQDSTEQAEQS